ncbi:hypothetical protein DCAR_0310503 [Daucus carota subsp. sativus]|uniref:Uncharacterized protein n=1 Tax=Daucus carota subsp. sativus TaxID=79200 RepID=A0AAF0WNK9_DAUCS|nr:PREDICTED: pentatricopeptide repeat-containing protein At3g53360, mitochondrial [Daucus carota subsp. sativus]WOG91255.1 hypothetical protein DCAR_0310503 [Daucus carota subsp. sativus]
MLKTLETKLHSSSTICNNINNVKHIINPTTITSNFKNENSSNDYISFLCKQKQYSKALDAFHFLHNNTTFSLKPSTYANLFSACSYLKSIKQGRIVHDHLLLSGCKADIILQNHILNMYGKCGSLSDAVKVFDEMSERNIVSWTSLIAGYSQNGRGVDAVRLYIDMQRSGVMPDQFTFGSVIRACANMSDDVELGRQLHGNFMKSEFGSSLIPLNALIAMYNKYDRIIDASSVFSRIKTKDLISWSSMISGFSQLGYELEALCCFKEMISLGVYQPNEFIFGSILSACGSLRHPQCGRQIHGMSIKFGLGGNLFAGCSLSDMYAKCGLLHCAQIAFFEIESPDLVSWNAIIAGFAYGGYVNDAISFFSRMRHMGFTPDNITIRSLLCAFTNPYTLNQGKQAHSYIIKHGLSSDVTVSNTILSMYAKCLNLSDAFGIFNEIKSNADLVSWNAILTVCMHHKQAAEVFKVIKMLLLSQNRPDHITLAIVLGACGEISSLEMGDQVHCYATKSAHKVDTFVANGLIDMYTKCGSLVSARKLFDCMRNPDVISWSSLIVGYAQCGYGEEALHLFREMKSSGVKPNQVTFVGVLTACSHVGLLQEGWQLFTSMETEHGVVPTKEHCSCVVDLLARAGCIKEAEAFINHMPFDPDIVVWKTLLAACKTNNNVEVAKRAAESILSIDPSNSAAHVLLCSIYASNGSWKDVKRLRSLMKQNSVRKVPGQSWIEVKDKMHVFLAEDFLHSERDHIYSLLDELWLQMLDAGFVPLRK